MGGKTVCIFFFIIYTSIIALISLIGFLVVSYPLTLIIFIPLAVIILIYRDKIWEYTMKISEYRTKKIIEKSKRIRKEKEIKYPESQPKPIKEIKYPKSEEKRETSE